MFFSLNVNNLFSKLAFILVFEVNWFIFIFSCLVLVTSLMGDFISEKKMQIVASLSFQCLYFCERNRLNKTVLITFFMGGGGEFFKKCWMY